MKKSLLTKLVLFVLIFSVSFNSGCAMLGTGIAVTLGVAGLLVSNDVANTRQGQEMITAQEMYSRQMVRIQELEDQIQELKNNSE